LHPVDAAADAGPVPLSCARTEAIYGGKSVNLGAMLRAHLPVPNGWALSADFAHDVARGDIAAIRRLLDFGAGLGNGLFAVRSSAIGEDSAEASFAGQHETVLGVRGAHALVAAVLRVVKSGASQSARAYRKAAGDHGEARVGVAVQRLLDPVCAGVMFTRNPVSGADERVIEAAWGLGEAVVASRVTPDRFRFARGGRVLQADAGDKPLSLHPLPGGGVSERQLDAAAAKMFCLDETDIAALDRLADDCERVFGPHQDIEWAKADGRPFLLLARAITRAG
jgi:pyruvate,water dikinase